MTKLAVFAVAVFLFSAACAQDVQGEGDMDEAISGILTEDVEEASVSRGNLERASIETESRRIYNGQRFSLCYRQNKPFSQCDRFYNFWCNQNTGKCRYKQCASSFGRCRPGLACAATPLKATFVWKE